MRKRNDRLREISRPGYLISNQLTGFSFDKFLTIEFFVNTPVILLRNKKKHIEIFLID